jgi:endonuclease G
VGNPDEVRNLIGLVDVPPEAAVINVPDIRPGIPDAVRRLAELYARERGQDLTGADAVLSVFNEVQVAARQAGGSLEAAQGQVPPEAIVIVNAMLRPALIVCNDRVGEEVPKDWAAALKGKEPILADILRSVGLISCQNVLRPGTVQSDLPAPVGTGFVVAPGVVMTNCHVALEFAEAGGAFRAIPGDGEAEPSITINFAAEKCSSLPRVYRISKVLHIEREPGPDVALLKVEDPKGELVALPLQREVPKDSVESRDVLTPGYPFDDYRNPQAARLKIFGNLYGIKRLSPGQLMKGSGKKGADGKTYLLHDCSTLGGNSGSPVVDLESRAVYGLHFGGVYGNRNYAWPMWRVCEIDAVKNILDGAKPANGQGGK